MCFAISMMILLSYQHTIFLSTRKILDFPEFLSELKTELKIIETILKKNKKEPFYLFKNPLRTIFNIALTTLKSYYNFEIIL